MPSVSADGRLVVFQSSSTDLVAGIPTPPPGDEDAPPPPAQIYIRDVVAGTTKLVSASASGTPGDFSSDTPVITPNGRTIVFYSYATNLVPGDTNGSSDVFEYDVATGVTTRVSLAADGSQANNGVLPGYHSPAAVSDDGKTVVFTSSSTNLVPGVGSASSALVYARDLRRGTTVLVSANQAGQPAQDFSQGQAISGDGRVVAFSSLASNLVPGDTNNNYDVFVRDLRTGTVTRVSVSSTGAQGTGSSSTDPVISRDGSTVAFMSGANGLTSDGPANPTGDIFVRNLRTGTTVKASIGLDGQSGNGWSGSRAASLSADGRYVSFQSLSTNLVSQPLASGYHVFVRDLLCKNTRVVTTAPNESGGGGYAGGLTASGKYVVFYSWASDLVPGWTNSSNPQIYLRRI
ncbi:TolB family protein [Kitasatospora azatica]|uniref:TolB family protein n=1 Tax=Kitasatospora azatica TaxID=58347 RepID=UPI00056795F8|nr:PD40 domain-containing protein [Kitasatospora azatica]